MGIDVKGNGKAIGVILKMEKLITITPGSS